MAGLFGDAGSQALAAGRPVPASGAGGPAQPLANGTLATPVGGTPAAPDTDALIAEAARNLAEYQRLTAEGKLGEAGQRLDALKQKLDQLNRRPRR